MKHYWFYYVPYLVYAHNGTLMGPGWAEIGISYPVTDRHCVSGLIAEIRRTAPSIRETDLIHIPSWQLLREEDL